MKHTYTKADIAKAKKAEQHREESAFVNLRSLMGNTWAQYYCAIGAAQSGKTYSAAKIGLNLKRKHGANVKWYWLRLTDTSAKKLLQDNASKLIDWDLVRKYDLDLKAKGSEVYDINHDSDNPLVTVLPLSTVYSNKGLAYFDKDFSGEYFIIFDEMNRDTYAGEKVTFDITYNLKRTLENLLRNTGSSQAAAKRARVLMLGNTMAEASDVLLSFGFVPNPDQFGRYKLRSRGLVLDYLPLTRAYIKMRSGAVVDKLTATNESGFTNQVEADMSLIDSKPLIKPAVIIKFTDSKSDWFVVWDTGTIKMYNGETISNVIAMRRYIQNTFFNPQSVSAVFELFDSRGYRYHNYYTYVNFRFHLMKLKPITR